MTPMPKIIPFNRPHLTGREQAYLNDVLASAKLAGNGAYAGRCARRLEALQGAARVLPTHSATAALEMAAILAGICPGDEVIMPSFTFVSTANAVVLRGATPVFVDVCEDTLNVDPAQVAAAISPRTKAILPVHYAGVACDMARLMDIAATHGVMLIEDAAQGLGATWRGRPLGTLGRFAAFSFHETKNIICGEGGALVVNDPAFVERAEIILEKGTNRQNFLRGEVDKYTWLDVGSSFVASELSMAVLLAQLEAIDLIQRQRAALWDRYHALLAAAENAGHLRRPVVPKDCRHNAHIYYVLLRAGVNRKALISGLRQAGVHLAFHFVPLHASPGGQRFGRTGAGLPVTEDVAARLVRLPLYPDLTEPEQDRVVAELLGAIEPVR